MPALIFATHILITFLFPVAHAEEPKLVEVSAAEVAAPPLGIVHLSGGVGLEGRLQQDLNPDFPEARAIPQVFTQIYWRTWSLAIEGGPWDKRESSAGGLSVQSSTWKVSGWGRYRFRESIKWAPFVTAGMGAYVDTITSQYRDEVDTRAGRRDFMGGGGGLTHAIGGVLLEGELRVSLIEDRKDLAVAGIFRLGFIL